MEGFVREAGGLLADQAGATGELREPENHEFSWFDGRDPDLAHRLPGVDAFGRVGLVIAFHVESLVWGLPEQRATAPFVDQKSADSPAYHRPKSTIVGFKHNPPGSIKNGRFQIVEQATNIQISPCRVRR